MFNKNESVAEAIAEERIRIDHAAWALESYPEEVRENYLNKKYRGPDWY